ALFVLRHPREVVDSITARNRWPQGLSRLLWIQHLLEAEAGSRDVPRAILPYASLLADPVAALNASFEALGVGGVDMSRDVRDALAGFLSAGDRHHVHDAGLEPGWELPVGMFHALSSSP